jgi:hypothetical protein
MTTTSHFEVASTERIADGAAWQVRLEMPHCWLCSGAGLGPHNQSFLAKRVDRVTTYHDGDNGNLAISAHCHGRIETVVMTPEEQRGMREMGTRWAFAPPKWEPPTVRRDGASAHRHSRATYDPGSVRVEFGGYEFNPYGPFTPYGFGRSKARR